ncbi:DUF1638 domain-containing protein [Fodinicurvata fenggangensis]|uniref:DUF1638 domain-containing protein n=1 Tax=Fodinicurvata fenggangensis TaxID=1121830 RepID=UPI00047CA9F9|nr:DUF1638 domain-containing protein [Fodinicurvata fenggangensis]
MSERKTLVLACGALAREIVDAIRLNGWSHLQIRCLPAIWHNTPQRIPEALRGKIRKAREEGFEEILVAYGDCGTGGLLDAMLAEEGVERIAGDHCYAFYAGLETFAELQEADPATFYLTDYLVRHFDRLVVRGLGLDRHPDLLQLCFGNYNRLIYLAQTHDPELQRQAVAAADRLGLSYEYRYCGLGGLAGFLGKTAQEEAKLSWPA